MRLACSILALAFGVAVSPPLRAQNIPALQVVPHAHEQTAVEWEGRELFRYHFAPSVKRPFLYPLIGPSGKSLTRIGHPHDPQSHSHHNSLWVSHFDVAGVDFWGDHGKDKGTIRTRRVVRYEDGQDEALLEFVNAWETAGGVTLLDETRTLRVRPGQGKQWLLILDLKLSAAKAPVTLGKTPFGLVGVRLTKTIGVHDGGGVIRNSVGGKNEAEVLWKQARWVDYSGPVAKGVMEGITLLDHPENPGHPNYFHVRDDGWMGASLTYAEPRTITVDKPLGLRYGFWIHSGQPDVTAIDAAFAEFAKVTAPQNPANRR